jgi:hypothetical protein
VGSKGLVQETSMRKEHLHLGFHEDSGQIDGDSLLKARRNLDSAFNLDSAEGHIEGSNEAEASLNLYAYGVWISSIVHFYWCSHFMSSAPPLHQ